MASDRSAHRWTKRPSGKCDKWRNSILIASYPQWFFDSNTPVPYGPVTEFLRGPSGIVHLPALAMLMGKATDAECAALAARYDVVKNAVHMRPLLAYSRAQPDILRPSGLAVDADMLQFLRQLPGYGANPATRDGPLERIRLSETTRVTKRGTRELWISAEGLVASHWTMIDGIRQELPSQP